MAIPVGPPPTTEQGTVTPQLYSVMSWGDLSSRQFVDDREYVPELMWPLSVDTYDRMMTDTQVKGLYYGATIPIRRYRWSINPNGSRPEVYQKFAEDIGLPIKGEEPKPAGRRKGRFSFSQHLEDALRALIYGHYCFEQVGKIEDDGLWHLRKLAPRPPRTILEIDVAKDGGLKGIKQNTGPTTPMIDIGRLVWYGWDVEGGNWIGNSMMRSCFRNWLVKDRLMRVDAVGHERNSVGMPIIKAPPNASPEVLKALGEMARAYRVTETGGGAIPDGADMKLLGVQGSVSNPVASMQFHNQEMAQAFLMMFVELGQTATGSRALGESFIDYFAYAQEGIADWFKDTFNEHVTEDWVDWNFGEDEPTPQLCYDRSDNEDLPVTELVSLIDAGAIVVDDDLENELRKKHKLPAKAEGAPAATPPSSPIPGAKARRSSSGVKAAESLPSDSLPLPARQLRRQPYDHEVQAAVDFAQIDSDLTTELDNVVEEVNGMQAAQIDQLHDLIIDADGDLDALATLQADPVAGDTILAHMQSAADAGIDQAAGEAERQGVSAKKPKLPELEDALTARAQAVDKVLARSISEAAGRKALTLTGGSLAPADVAAQVKDYLTGLSGSYLKDQLGGAMTQAMNSGRKLTIQQNNPVRIYGSELLDSNTCEECVAVDGREYTNMADAESDYPTGGFSDCLGGPRCRGTLVAVYDEAGA